MSLPAKPPAKSVLVYIDDLAKKLDLSKLPDKPAKLPGEEEIRPLRPSPEELEEIMRGLAEPENLESLAPLMTYEVFKNYCEAKPYNNAHRYVREWYLRTIPNLTSPRFTSFVIGSRELVRMITGKDDISLVLQAGSTAYMDAKGRRVVLPSEAFILEAYAGSRLAEGSNLGIPAIAIANGNICHESAHFSQSPEDIAKAIEMGVDYIERNSANHVFRKRVREIDFSVSALHGTLMVIANVCEDLFIENWLRDETPAYAPFIEATHEFYFSQEELLRRMFKHCDIEEGEDKISSDAIVDALIMAKNWRFTEAPFWGPLVLPYLEMMRGVIGCDSPAKRAAIAIEIWVKLINDREVKYAPPTAPGAMAIMFDSEGKSLVVDVSKLLEMLDKEGEKARRGGATPEEKSVRKMVMELSDALAEASLMMDIEEKRDHDRISQVPETKIEKMPRALSKSSLDKRFVSLGQRLRMELTNNDVPGPPMKRGPVIVNTRLNRIITDGKIFSHRQPRKASGKDFEFCVLVDCSGSMHGRKIEEAMTAGYTAYFSLRQARIRTTLLGHTSGRYGKEHPVVYRIGAPTDSMDEVAMRAGKLTDSYSRSDIMGNNYDGFAILKAAEIGFSEKPAKRYMFVISDGQPSGSGYGGESAILHTKDCVKQVRSQGIDVVSITIEHGAVEVNSRIYGKEKNVATNSPLVLNELIQAIFAKHIH